jgi:outer membrane protein OmpA-like peptidoglycan-associated protein
MLHSQSMKSRLVRVLLASGLVWQALGARVQAEQLSETQIFEALTVRHTRSLVERPPQNQEDQNFVESLRHRGSRSLSLSDRDRDRVATIVKNQPAVDLEIYFDYDSAKITPQAVPQLSSLGRSLAEPQLKDAVILVAGHTDATGSNTYNQVLSQRRAESVKQFLISRFNLTAANLVTAGYGKQELKNVTDPFAAENRRVQIGNLNAKPEAHR